MPSWHVFHTIALILGAILPTIDCVYLQLPGGNPPLAELKASQIAQCRILYPMTSVGCAFSTARCVGSCVGWLHSWDNLGTTQLALRCTGSERYKWYVVQKQLLALLTFLTTSTESRLEASHS